MPFVVSNVIVIFINTRASAVLLVKAELELGVTFH